MTWRDTPAERQLPGWVKIWRLARGKGDQRLLAEQEPGYQILDREWDADMNITREPSGYDWNTELETHGLMPERDRQRYAKPVPKIQASDDDIPF